MIPIVTKLAGLETVELNAVKDAAASAFMIGNIEFNIPQSANTDVEAEKERIAKEMDYFTGFRASVIKKLSNERFVANAPEAVVAAERKKLADADAKIATLKASLEALS